MIINRYHRRNDMDSHSWITPQLSTANSATTINVVDADKTLSEKFVGLGKVLDQRSCYPVLTSNCPGWVCYAEKSQPQSIPYLSTVKSSQQILGTVVKSILKSLQSPDINSGVTSEQLENVNGDGLLQSLQTSNLNIYVVSVQPCFDKKLEASRLVNLLYYPF